MSALPRIAILAMLSAASAACTNVRIEALTTPPATATAELDDEARTMTVSQGIALGFECIYQSGPCKGATASADDPAIVSVRKAALDALAPASVDPQSGRTVGAAPRAAFVVVGISAGSTTLTIDADDGSAKFDVRVTPR